MLAPREGGGLPAVRAAGVIATTFTTAAAAELEERVRVKLLESGLSSEADDLANAMIGTVHSVGSKLLQRFAFEAGVSPQVEVIADDDQQRLFNQSLASVLTPELINQMEELSTKLGFNKSQKKHDWRVEVKTLTDAARANNMDFGTLERSLQYSLDSYFALLPAPSNQSDEHFFSQLAFIIEETIQRMENNADTTAKKNVVMDTLRGIRLNLKNTGTLSWHELAKLMKLDVAVKSREDAAELLAYAATHDSTPAFHKDIKTFITNIFEIAIAALKAFEEYKRNRGLIDYIDMETQVLRLLENPSVRETLRDELDLLLVDEFQDTNPIQLQIFLELTRLAKQAIWVGDPKQSIYGFRGAAPELMEAVIAAADETDVLRYSWRSREDLVHSANGIFTKAFAQMPEERVALSNPEPHQKINEPAGLGLAVNQWHFTTDDGSRTPGSGWIFRAMSHAIREWLGRDVQVRNKGGSGTRALLPGDIAVLCRSNFDCQSMADALAKEGIKASVSRAGLLLTAEARLALACLKYLLYPSDSLSVAEILLLADNQRIEDIIEHRLDYLEAKQEAREKRAAGEYQKVNPWASETNYIEALDKLRKESMELSCSETLNVVLDQLDLRRVVAAWGNPDARFANIDALRALAGQYEDACNRLHAAATTGGFLLWLDELAREERDFQGASGSQDAVNVMTYHKSKGLEWPVVLCHSLEGTLRDAVYGLNIVRESEEISLENPLANRLLRYWVNPYDDQIKGTNLATALETHEAKKLAVKQALEEEARVLYVGITRARDYLILPTRQGYNTKWLNRVWHGGREDVPVLDPESTECAWLWNAQPIPISAETFALPKDYEGEGQGDLQAPISYLPERAGVKKHKPLLLDVAEAPAVSVRFSPGKIVSFGSGVEPEAIALLDAFLVSDDLSYSEEERLVSAQRLLRNHPGTSWDAVALVAFSDGFYQTLSDLFNIQKTRKKIQIRGQREGRRFETELDFLLETNAGPVLLFHSAFNGEQSKWKNKALEDAARYALASEALGHVQPRAVWVHFWCGGGLVELLPY